MTPPEMNRPGPRHPHAPGKHPLAPRSRWLPLVALGLCRLAVAGRGLAVRCGGLTVGARVLARVASNLSLSLGRRTRLRLGFQSGVAFVSAGVAVLRSLIALLGDIISPFGVTVTHRRVTGATLLGPVLWFLHGLEPILDRAQDRRPMGRPDTPESEGRAMPTHDGEDREHGCCLVYVANSCPVSQWATRMAQRRRPRSVPNWGHRNVHHHTVHHHQPTPGEGVGVTPASTPRGPGSSAPRKVYASHNPAPERR